MDKYGPLLRDDGAELRETSDAEKAQPDADEDYSCGDLPVDRSCNEDTIEDETESHITLRKLSSYEAGAISATPHALSLKPGNHPTEEGNEHRISANFVARVTGLDVQTVLSWARTESYFLRLEYNFTGHDLPRFASRALVVEDQDEEISLSGGLGSALRILKFVKTLDPGTTHGSQRPHFPPPRKRLLDQLRAANRIPSKSGRPRSRHPTFASRDMEPSSRLPHHHDGSTRFQPAFAPLLGPLPSFQDLDDQISVSTDYTEDSMETPPLTLATTETNWLGGQSEPVEILDSPYRGILEVNIPLFRGNTEWTFCHAKGQQLPDEAFEQRKRKARAMHAHNGDTSGMVSLMTLAATGPLDNYHNAFYNGTQN